MPLPCKLHARRHVAVSFLSLSAYPVSLSHFLCSNQVHLSRSLVTVITRIQSKKEMVKLASAREIRMYGPNLARNRYEYMNAGLYVFATILLLCGFAVLLADDPRPGLVLLLIAFGIIIVVNLHDLMAHLAGIDYWLPLMELDAQLSLVEFTVPVVLAVGTLLNFLGILFLFIQAEIGYDYKLGNHALNMLIAGTALWMLGSIHNACQVYERADGHFQILQVCVQIPFLMGSLLFLVGAILNSREQAGYILHGLYLLSETWVWFGIFGCFLFFIGGMMNVIKVFKMQQINGLRLEKLRGGAQERLIQVREGQVPLIRDEQRRRIGLVEEGVSGAVAVVGPTPYKDVLVGQS